MPITTQKTTLADRLTRREIVASLDLSNMGDLYRLRVKLGAAFPSFINGTASKSEILALKHNLANPDASVQPVLTAAAQQGRRIGIERRRL